MRKTLLHAIGAFNTWIYRLSGGRLMGRFPSGAPVCLLTTTGRRSGQARTAPLLYLQDGADYIVVASQGGAPTHPAWFLNLQHKAEGELEVGKRRFRVTSRELSEPERAEFWPRLVAIYPAYETYRQRTTRKIPLVRLTPAERSGQSG